MYLINDGYKPVNSYEEIEKDFVLLCEESYGSILICTPDEIFNADTNSNITVERIVGLVTNRKTGNGKILNTSSADNYISYADTDFKINEGTIILTYLVYDGEDVAARYDYVLDREYED
jgi:hypothetical protein